MCRKLNCWEFKNCGREKGGLMVGTLGECPVPEAMKSDGINGGIAAGRTCWTIMNSGQSSNVGNGCNGNKCHTCPFYRRVIHEEKDACFKFSCTADAS